jgi:hypothetical protein
MHRRAKVVTGRMFDLIGGGDAAATEACIGTFYKSIVSGVGGCAVDYPA